MGISLVIMMQFLKLRVDASGQPVTKHNHVNQHGSRNANAAILGNRRRLFQQQRHHGIQRYSDDNGMDHHG